MSRNAKLFSGVCVLAIAAGAQAAYAQTETVTAESEEAPAAEQRVEDVIIVTAQRRAERLEDVPISITAVSSAKLEAANITSFSEIGSISPGTIISQQGPFYLPAIRGITTQSITSGQENNIATYVDGVYQANKVGLNFDFNNIEGIEILKGPQGTLFGRNATGGAILVKTLDPGDEPEARIGISYGSYNDKRVQVYASTPLSDTVGFNIAGYWRDSDGYVRDVSGFDTGYHEELNVRTKLKFDPSENFSATIALNYFDLSDPLGIAWTFVDNPGAAVLAPGVYVESRPNRTSFGFQPVVDTESFGASATLEYDFGSVVLKSISSYTDYKHRMLLDVDGSAAPIVTQDTEHENDTIQQEFNLSSDYEGAFSWVLGAYYFNNKYDLNKNQINGAVPFFRNSLEVEAYALYADGTLQLSDRWFLTGGVRYSAEEATVEPVHSTDTPATLTTADWDSFTPRISLRYEISSDTNVYATFSQGFKSGTFDPTNPVPIKVEPEEIDAYEVGFKTYQGNYRFDAAAYYYDFANLQDSQTVSTGVIGGGLATQIANVASSEIYGGEIQASYDPTENLSIYGGVAYTHAEYTSYPDASGAAVVTTPLGDLWTTIPQDWKGLTPPRAPEWMINLGANYTVDVGAAGALEFSGNLAYTGEQSPTTIFVDPVTNQQLYVQDAYTLINLSAAWHLPGDRATISVYGKNIGDESYHLVHRAFNTFGRHEIFGAPATYGVKLTYDF